MSILLVLPLPRICGPAQHCMDIFNVTAHYITAEWEMKTAMLATHRVEERHTGENIGNILKGIQSEFNIKTVAAREANYPNVGCFSHTLQLAVNDSFKLPSIHSVIINARRLVTFFSKSVLAAQALEDNQKRLGKDVKRLIGDVSTRWNSAYFMLSRLHELKPDIYSVIRGNSQFEKKICYSKITNGSLLIKYYHCYAPSPVQLKFYVLRNFLPSVVFTH